MAEEKKNPEPSQPAQKHGVVPFDLPVLPLHNTTLFPDTMVPLAVGRIQSIAAVEAALASEEKLLAAISVKPENASELLTKPVHVFEVGTLVMIKRMERVEDTLHLIVQGLDRIQLVAWEQQEPFMKARVRVLPGLSVVD